MFLKRLFYVSASLFLLAAAYHLGASTAGAQIQNTIWSANRADAMVGVVSGRTIRWMSTGINSGFGTTGSLPPVPGSAEIVQFCVGNQACGNAEGTAILADGSVWTLPICTSAWIPVGNLLSGSTPTTATTFGALKAKYR